MVVIKMSQKDDSKKHLFFETPQMLVLFVSLGKFLETIAEKRTTDAIQKLIDMEPKSTILIVPTELEVTCSTTSVNNQASQQLDNIENCIRYFGVSHSKYRFADVVVRCSHGF